METPTFYKCRGCGDYQTDRNVHVIGPRVICWNLFCGANVVKVDQNEVDEIFCWSCRNTYFTLEYITSGVKITCTNCEEERELTF